MLKLYLLAIYNGNNIDIQKKLGCVIEFSFNLTSIEIINFFDKTLM